MEDDRCASFEAYRLAAAAGSDDSEELPVQLFSGAEC